MKTLLLLRHAKSTAANTQLADSDRPLNAQGKTQAERIGRYLKEEQLNADLVLSSPALRARETTQLVLQSAELLVEVRYDERIYDASPFHLLELISAVENARRVVLLVGHNPGIEELVGILTGHFDHMTAAALAKIENGEGHWNTLAENTCKLAWMITANELSQTRLP